MTEFDLSCNSRLQYLPTLPIEQKTLDNRPQRSYIFPGQQYSGSRLASLLPDAPDFQGIPMRRKAWRCCWHGRAATRRNWCGHIRCCRGRGNGAKATNCFEREISARSRKMPGTSKVPGVFWRTAAPPRYSEPEIKHLKSCLNQRKSASEKKRQ